MEALAKTRNIRRSVVSSVGNAHMARYSGKRKHRSQMTKQEVNGLFKRLKSVNPKAWRLIPHALERISEKGIQATQQDVVSTMFYADIIEYKINYSKRINSYDERVVLRAKSIVNRCYNLHVVYSLTTKEVITVWINHVNDLHATLDYSLYTRDMKVFGV